MFDRTAVEAWIANAESRPAVMLSWIRDVPALGMAARRLQREVTESFITMIQTLSASRAQLPGLMAVGGLLLVLGTALTTWLIALYSSFRVAGPLYRFCIDLEHGIREGQVPRIRVRASDAAQDDARYLEETVSGLYRHQDEIAGTAEEALRHLCDGSADAAAAAGQRLRRLTDACQL